MYPFNLELQYKKDFAGRFAKYAKPFTQEVIARLRSEHRADSDVSVRVDSLEDMLEYIRKLREKYGERIEAEKLEKIIKKDFTQIDAWARDKSNEVMGKMYSRLNTPQPPSVTGRPTPKGQAGELWMTTVKPFNNLSQPNKDLIDEAVKRNVHLINEKYKAHFDDIERIVKENILSGKSRKEIAKELMETTGVNISQAEFWARDQSSKFFGEATRIRQQGAGIPGYIWRCVGDNKTRDRHSDLEGTYHKWGNPPIVDLLSGRKADPGGDYNCRCHAEPALGPEMADREYTDPKPDDNYYENIRPGTEKAKWSENGGIAERMVIDIQDVNLRKSVDNMIGELDKVFNIDPKRIKHAITVTDKMSFKNLDKDVKGVFVPASKAIALKPGTLFPERTFLHEFMHYMSFNQFKSRVKVGNKVKYTGALASVLYIIKESGDVKKIRKIIKTGQLPSGKKLTEKQIEKFKYLLKTEELFARASEQYMFVYKGSIERNRTAMLQKIEGEYGYLLDKNDARKLYEALDVLFKKEGLIE